MMACAASKTLCLGPKKITGREIEPPEKIALMMDLHMIEITRQDK